MLHMSIMESNPFSLLFRKIIMNKSNFSISLYSTFYNCRKMTEPSEIITMAGDIQIGYVVGLNMWNHAVYDRECTFETIMKEDLKIEIPYVELETIIEIEIKGRVPDTIELKDSVLDENGVIKSRLREDKTIPFTFSNELDINPAVFLSSNIEDYSPGRTTRGFRLTCSWGDNQCEYDFIIRTDAI